GRLEIETRIGRCRAGEYVDVGPFVPSLDESLRADGERQRLGQRKARVAKIHHGVSPLRQSIVHGRKLFAERIESREGIVTCGAGNVVLPREGRHRARAIREHALYGDQSTDGNELTPAHGITSESASSIAERRLLLVLAHESLVKHIPLCAT